MRFLLATGVLASLVLARPPAVAPPRPLLEVARFRALDQTRPTAEIEVNITVPTQGLLYRQRIRRAFQASATLELSLTRADGGQPVWRETVALRPPVLTDTARTIKNPFSLLRRVLVPDGAYVLRAALRDDMRPTSEPKRTVVVEQPVEALAPTGVAFSDVLLLGQPAARVAAGEGDNVRGGYQLTRAPTGLYARGADVVFFYAELSGLPAGRPVRLRYRLASGAPETPATPAAPAAPANKASALKPAAAEATLTALPGRPTPVVGRLPLGALPAGPFTLTLEARDATTNKLLASQRQTGSRNPTDYIQAGASSPGARP